MRSSTTTTGSSGTSGGGGGGTISCQDCGNKAKRDCEHMRCRTCCKTRGFHCATHVRSTWVPVARRRLRHHHHQQQILLPSSAAVDHRRHRHHDHHLADLPLSLSRTSTSSCLHHSEIMLGLGESGDLPAEVNSVATFRCIRVSSEDNNVVDQYAYQTSINIGGHNFKGILYDQGRTTTAASCTGGGESSSAAMSDNHHHHLRHYQLDITASSAAASASLNPPPPSSGGANLLYPPPPSLYSAPFNTFLPGMQFFPHPRPN